MRKKGALAAVLAALTLAGPAVAATTSYYGYGWISPTSPPKGACFSWRAGIACAGWNYWDYSQIDIRTSGYTYLGFIFTRSSTTIYVRGVFGPGTFTAAWNAREWGSEATHYNRPSCLYGTATVWAQCRAIRA